MGLEIGERVLFHSLLGEVEDTSSDLYVGLFGHSGLASIYESARQGPSSARVALTGTLNLPRTIDTCEGYVLPS